MQDPSSTSEMLLSLLPFLVVTIVYFFFAIPIGRRKGKGIGFVAWGLIPFVIPFILFYLVSLTDKSVLDRLEALEGKASQ
jgi:hypothetical protein